LYTPLYTLDTTWSSALKATHDFVPEGEKLIALNRSLVIKVFTLEHELRSATTEINTLHTKYNTLLVTNDALQKAFDNLTLEFETIGTLYTNKTTQFDDMVEKYQTLSDSYSALRNQFDSVYAKYDSALEQLDSVKEKYYALLQNDQPVTNPLSTTDSSAFDDTFLVEECDAILARLTCLVDDFEDASKVNDSLALSSIGQDIIIAGQTLVKLVVRQEKQDKDQLRNAVQNTEKTKRLTKLSRIGQEDIRAPSLRRVVRYQGFSRIFYNCEQSVPGCCQQGR